MVKSRAWQVLLDRCAAQRSNVAHQGRRTRREDQARHVSGIIHGVEGPTQSIRGAPGGRNRRIGNDDVQIGLALHCSPADHHELPRLQRRRRCLLGQCQQQVLKSGVLRCPVHLFCVRTRSCSRPPIPVLSHACRRVSVAYHTNVVARSQHDQVLRSLRDYTMATTNESFARTHLASARHNIDADQHRHSSDQLLKARERFQTERKRTRSPPQGSTSG